MLDNKFILLRCVIIKTKLKNIALQANLVQETISRHHLILIYIFLIEKINIKLTNHRLQVPRLVNLVNNIISKLTF